MSDNIDVGKPPTAADRTWAKVRIVLGIGQMTGAVWSFWLLATTGVNELALGFVVGTSLLTTVSVLLFGRRGQRT